MTSHHASSYLHSRGICLFILLLASVVAPAADTNEFILQMTNRLGVSFPADAKVEHIKRHGTHEWFAVVTVSPTNAVTFKKDIAWKKRDPDSQNLLWHDKHSAGRLGFIPGPLTIPEAIKEWWGEVKADTTIYLSEFKRIGPNELSEHGAVMIFLSEEFGKLWVWSYELPK